MNELLQLLAVLQQDQSRQDLATIARVTQTNAENIAKLQDQVTATRDYVTAASAADDRLASLVFVGGLVIIAAVVAIAVIQMVYIARMEKRLRRLELDLVSRDVLPVGRMIDG